MTAPLAAVAGHRVAPIDLEAVCRGRVLIFDRVKDEARCRCVRSDTGKELWDFTYDTDYRDRQGYDGGPRAAPVTDGSQGREEEPVQSFDDAASSFLASRRVAVTGVSRTPKEHGSNTVYKRLRDRGYEVFAVNPNAQQVEGDRSYPNLASIPGGGSAVVTLVVNVSPLFSGTLINTATIAPSAANTIDSNDSATAETLVSAAPPSAIPTLSEWALGALVLLLTVTGVLFVRRI